MNLLFKALFVLFLVLGGGMLMGAFFTAGFEMPSAAMEPAIASGDLVLVNRNSIRMRDPQRGDLVLFHVPGEETVTIRRIIGLPHEGIEITNGVVSVNGQPLNEPWLKQLDKEGPKVDAPAPDFTAPIVTGDEMYFLMGDNRKGSRDSRVFGPVKKNLLLGRVWSFGYLAL